jgi:hypothetical protein
MPSLDFNEFVASMISPGAGLKTFDDSQIFDNSFDEETQPEHLDQLFDSIFGPDREQDKAPYVPISRHYENDRAM